MKKGSEKELYIKNKKIKKLQQQLNKDKFNTNHMCTFTKKDYYIVQQWFNCKTCTQYNKFMGCCLSCSKVCHLGHELVAENSSFYCDCGSGELPIKCKIIESQNKLQLLKINNSIEDDFNMWWNWSKNQICNYIRYTIHMYVAYAKILYYI